MLLTARTWNVTLDVPKMLADIAAKEPWVQTSPGYEGCYFCGVGRYSGDNHRHDCYWLVARFLSNWQEPQE